MTTAGSLTGRWPDFDCRLFVDGEALTEASTDFGGVVRRRPTAAGGRHPSAAVGSDRPGSRGISRHGAETATESRALPQLMSRRGEPYDPAQRRTASQAYPLRDAARNLPAGGNG